MAVIYLLIFHFISVMQNHALAYRGLSECSFTFHQLYAFSSSTVFRKLRTFIFVNAHSKNGIFSIKLRCYLKVTRTQSRTCIFHMLGFNSDFHFLYIIFCVKAAQFLRKRLYKFLIITPSYSR
jgi:hypothetical protein